jgi:hypothetical protein
MSEPIDTVLLDDVVGGLRTSASSQAELIPLLKATHEAVKDLARDQKPDPTQQMLPLMMLMMRR